jgi:hypothetical protein
MLQALNFSAFMMSDLPNKHIGIISMTLQRRIHSTSSKVTIVSVPNASYQKNIKLSLPIHVGNRRMLESFLMLAINTREGRRKH